MPVGRNDPCSCGSGRKYKKCCLRKDQARHGVESIPLASPVIAPPPTPPAPGAPAPIHSSPRMMFKFAKLEGVIPNPPSRKQGLRGAVVQFYVPTISIDSQEAARAFKKIARACDESIESVALHRAENPYKEPAILVSIAFHVPDITTAKDDADRLGRLIAERFLSFASYAVGLRVIGQSQHVSVMTDDGLYEASLRPRLKWSETPQKVAIADELVNARPTPDTFKALFWLRRALAERDPLDTFAASMVALEILASVLLPAEQIVSHCPHCKAEIGKRSTASVRRLVCETLGGTVQVFDRLWAARNSVVAHGGRAVDADVLSEVAELRFEALRLLFKAIGLALELPAEARSGPSIIVLSTDPFLYAE